MTRKQDRVLRGVPSSGEFSTTNRDEASIKLTDPAGQNLMDVHVWLTRNDLPLPDSRVQQVLDLASADSHPFTDIGLADAYRTVHQEHYGFSYDQRRDYDVALAVLDSIGRQDMSSSVRRVVELSTEHRQNLTDSVQEMPGIYGVHESSDPEVQAGGVFNTVRTADGTVFHRLTDGNWADEPQTIRLQASRPLTEDELDQVGDLTKYALAASVHGEVLGEPEQDTPYSFTLGYDFTKGSQERVDVFEQSLEEIVRQGSPPLKTNRKGPIGSQTVPGVGDAGLSFEIYYDRVGPRSYCLN